MSDFTDIAPGVVIEDNGDYRLPKVPWRRQLIELAGDFDGGVVTVGFEDLDGEFAPFVDLSGDPVTLSAAGYFEAITPSSGRLVFSLAGSTSPSIRWAHSRVCSC